MRGWGLFPRRLRAGCFVFRDPLPGCILLYLRLYFDSSQFLRTSLLAACLHECGHILVFAALFRRMPVIEVTLTGFCLQTRGLAMTAGQRFCLAAANALLASVWYLRISGRMTVWDTAFFAANVLTGLFNLLPIPPLDGAQMLAVLAHRGGK